MEDLHHSLSNKIRLSFAWELKFEKDFFWLPPGAATATAADYNQSL